MAGLEDWPVPGSGPTPWSACALELGAALVENDAHGIFERLGDQVVTGPTLTNVNDLRAVLIQGA